MITVAVANILESSHQALEFIYETSKMKGLKVQSISPENNIVYLHNKRVPLKQYLEVVEREKHYDLLIIELSKEAMKNQVYVNLDLNIVVLFDYEGYKKKSKLKRLHVTQHLLQGIKSHYYVLPDKYKHKIPRSITYGWSKNAHISATSAQKTVDGQMEMQCCIGEDISAINGQIIPLKEFGIESTLDSIEGVLAGVATLVIYGLDLE